MANGGNEEVFCDSKFAIEFVHAGFSYGIQDEATTGEQGEMTNQDETGDRNSTNIQDATNAQDKIPSAQGKTNIQEVTPNTNKPSYNLNEARNNASNSSVRDIFLSIKPGECVVVTGPSGCGKTTLTRMINGLIPSVYVGAEQGSVSVQGRRMTDWEMDDLSCTVGSVFQNPRSQFFNLDTTSEIAFGCENMGISRDEIAQRVANTMHALKIEHLIERDIRALSGGEKQLIALASVYSMNPSIFVLDEPTAALDISAMKRLRDTVASMKQDGKTILVAEHRLWWLAGIVDRIVVMDKGRIVEDLPAQKFSSMSFSQQTSYGLRAWDIRDVRPAKSETKVPRKFPENQLCPQASTKPLNQDSAPIQPLTPIPTPTSVPVLQVRGLEVRYKKSAVSTIQNCNFEACAGRAVALVGRNGAGKTTLCRCLAGLHKEKAGSVVVDGTLLSSKQRAGKIYLAMQESGYQLFSDTVAGELELALQARDLRDKRILGNKNISSTEATHANVTNLSHADIINQKLDDFGLLELKDRHPLSLSGGQRQRLAIVAGALQGARVMILDEPTSGLDLRNMKRVAREIEHLKAQGVCVVIITHDFEFACATCDEIAYLDEGHITDHFELTEQTLDKARSLFGF